MGPIHPLLLATDAAPSHNPQSKFSYAALCFVARYSHDERHYRAQLALHRVIKCPQLPRLHGPATACLILLVWCSAVDNVIDNMKKIKVSIKHTVLWIVVLKVSYLNSSLIIHEKQKLNDFKISERKLVRILLLNSFPKIPMVKHLTDGSYLLSSSRYFWR